MAFIKKINPLVQVEEHSFFQTDWQEYITQIQKAKAGKFQFHSKSPLVYLDNDQYIGGSREFMTFAEEEFHYQEQGSFEMYCDRTQELLRKITFENPFRAYCYMNIQIGQAEPMTAIFELFTDIAPQTCKNFIELCKGFASKKGKPVGYAGKEFHRVVSNVFIQGGKIGKGKKKSIFHGEFADESFAIKHDQRGILGMAKRDGLPHTNQSQFYVTLAAPLTFMDKKYVAFGRVIQGLAVFEAIEKLALPSQRPSEKCTIVSCGPYIHGEQTALGDEDMVMEISEEDQCPIEEGEEEQAEKIIEESNDTIPTLPELRKTFATITKYLSNDELLTKFAEKKFVAIDTDQNDVISFNELWEFMNSTLKKKKLPQATEKQVEMLMKRYDKDNNGVISHEEFGSFIIDLFKSSRQTLIIVYGEVKANDLIAKLSEPIKGNPKGVADMEEILEDSRKYYVELKKCAQQIDKATAKELTLEDINKICNLLCQTYGAPTISKEDFQEILKDVCVSDATSTFTQGDLRIISIVVTNIAKSMLRVATNAY